jgi:hypothetical protein
MEESDRNGHPMLKAVDVEMICMNIMGIFMIICCSNHSYFVILFFLSLLLISVPSFQLSSHRSHLLQRTATIAVCIPMNHRSLNIVLSLFLSHLMNSLHRPRSDTDPSDFSEWSGNRAKLPNGYSAPSNWLLSARQNPDPQNIHSKNGWVSNHQLLSS